VQECPLSEHICTMPPTRDAEMCSNVRSGHTYSFRHNDTLDARNRPTHSRFWSLPSALHALGLFTRALVASDARPLVGRVRSPV
jgi:hypothetical protein